MLLLCPGRGADYCDQFVCLFVCLSVFLSVCACVCVCPRAYLWNRWTDLHDFLGRSHVDVARSSSGGAVIRYVLLFMDDVTFGRSGPYSDVWKAEPLTYYH